MQPSSDESDNPFQRPSAYGRMPQKPFAIGALPKAAPSPPRSFAGQGLFTGSAIPEPLRPPPAPQGEAPEVAVDPASTPLEFPAAAIRARPAPRRWITTPNGVAVTGALLLAVAAAVVGLSWNWGRKASGDGAVRVAVAPSAVPPPAVKPTAAAMAATTVDVQPPAPPPRRPAKARAAPVEPQARSAAPSIDPPPLEIPAVSAAEPAAPTTRPRPPGGADEAMPTASSGQ